MNNNQLNDFLGVQEFEEVMHYHLNVSEEEAQAIIADGFDEVAQVRCRVRCVHCSREIVLFSDACRCKQGCLEAFGNGTLPSGNEENFAEVWKNWVKVRSAYPHAREIVQAAYAAFGITGIREGHESEGQASFPPDPACTDW